MMASEIRLELDVGNSSIKWRRLRGDVRLEGGRASDLAALAAQLPAVDATVWVASVASEAHNRALAAFFAARGVHAQFAESVAVCAGVTNGYPVPGRLGVDRWLAMLAAFRLAAGPCVVVDAGSALTIDLIAADGRHVGGYIIPGADLMLAALSDNTGRVRFGGESRLSDAPGVNTEECVHHGKWLALVGAVERALAGADRLWSKKYKVFVSGGDGDKIAALFGGGACFWHVRPELVLDGLVLAMSGEQEGR